MKTSKSAKRSLPSRIPRISTRGYYDLGTGKTLRNASYDLYPEKFFQNLGRFSEFTIVIHGMRNNRSGALAKFAMAQKRLRQLGYKHPVVGFTYDANVKNAHIHSQESRAIRTAKIIAKKNGANLARFISQFKRKNPQTGIRLMGHSLGTEVILYALHMLWKKKMIDSVHYFGSSAPSDSFQPKQFGRIQNTVSGRIINYYSPQDDVLRYAYEQRLTKNPIGYLGKEGKSVSKYVQKKVMPRNHRFASYLQVLKAFP